MTRRCPDCAAEARPQARYCPHCATQLPAEQESPPLARPRRRWRWSWRRLVATVAVLVVLALLATGQRILQNTLTDPTDPVAEAIAAIEAADMAALDATIRGHDLANRDNAFLFNRVLSEGYTPPEHIEIDKWKYCHPGQLPGADRDAESERPNREFACVWVDYQLADPSAPITTIMVPVRRESTGWIRDWHITEPTPLLGEVDITNELGAPIQIGGAPIVGDTVAPQEALLGTYDITVTEPDPDSDEAEAMQLFETGQKVDTVHVIATQPPGAPTPVEITDGLAVADEVVEQATQQIHDHIDDCATSDDLRPADCPLEADAFESGRYRPVEGDVSWTIDTYPEITLTATADPLSGHPITVGTTTPGQATATWTYRNDDQEQTATVEINPAGTLDHNHDGDLTYHP